MSINPLALTLALRLSPTERKIAHDLLVEVHNRLRFLDDQRAVEALIDLSARGRVVPERAGVGAGELVEKPAAARRDRRGAAPTSGGRPDGPP